MWWLVQQLLTYRPHQWHLEGIPADRISYWVETDELDAVLKVHRKVSW